jgi:hypothetical protein
MIDLYRKNVVATVSQLAIDDPELVMEFIQKLRESGEIKTDDLKRIEDIARKWISINQENLKKARR